MQRNIIIGIIVAMAVSAAHAQQYNAEADFDIKIIDGGHAGGHAVEITQYKGNGKTVSIPERIQNLPVTSVGLNSFRGKQLSVVVIPNGVINIGDAAFSGNRLERIDIPGSVTHIGYWTFAHNRLDSLAIPDSVIYIREGAFAANRLTSVTIPGSVTEIGDTAFATNLLESVVISSGVTRIGNEAFEENRLEHVTIPNSVTSIGKRAFWDNPIESVTIGADVELGYVDVDWVASAFYNGFDDFYRDNGSRAGTYIFADGGWSLSTTN